MAFVTLTHWDLPHWPCVRPPAPHAPRAGSVLFGWGFLWQTNGSKKAYRAQEVASDVLLNTVCMDHIIYGVCLLYSYTFNHILSHLVFAYTDMSVGRPLFMLHVETIVLLVDVLLDRKEDGV